MRGNALVDTLRYTLVCTGFFNEVYHRIIEFETCMYVHTADQLYIIENSSLDRHPYIPIKCTYIHFKCLCFFT